MIDYSAKEWTNYMNYTYIENYSPSVRVFKLDKILTQKHELYIEEDRTGRIYLPPFEIKALRDTNKWSGFLGVGVFGETEQDLIMHVNFDNMVNKIRELRNKRNSSLKLKYHGQGVPSISKEGGFLYIYLGGSIAQKIDLSQKEYNSVSKLSHELDVLPGFSCSYEGENDKSLNIVDFTETSFYNREVLFYSKDEVFKDITDVIETGDVILTERFRLYEVMEGVPAGEFGWSYHSWKLTCKLAEVEKMNLPGDFIGLIQKNEYGLRNKTKME